MPRLDWSDPANRLLYADLDPAQSWLLLPEPERRLIQRLWATCPRLDDPLVTSGIIVGLQTSADYVYHLERVAPGTYRCDPPGQRAAPFEVPIEDALMHPLVSGGEAKRYVQPRTETYILFPYERQDGRVRLIPAERLQCVYPRAWAYLRQWERELRAREQSAFDDSEWYRFGRNQNLDKQELSKLIVAQTVPNMRVCVDVGGGLCLNNVRVNGILPTNADDLFFLLGVLNGSVCDFVFRRIAAPKSGGYFEANKQFIAPLPVPPAEPVQRAEPARLAERLHDLTSHRRDKITQLDRRVAGLPARVRPEAWLWPDLASLDDWAQQAPGGLDTGERDHWARFQRDAGIASRLEVMKERLRPGAEASAELRDGELRFLVGGVPVVEGVFVAEAEADLVLAQWRRVARIIPITENTRAKTLAEALRRLLTDPASVGARQIAQLDRDIKALDDDVAAVERQLEDLLADLYHLSSEERLLVKRGR